MTYRMKTLLAAAVLALAASQASAQTKWNLPSAYPPDNPHVENLSLFAKDVADATVVLIYIGDDLGERVGPVLKKALKPGSRIVSHRFLLGDLKADKSITVKGDDGGDGHEEVLGEQLAVGQRQRHETDAEGQRPQQRRPRLTLDDQ